MKVLAFIRMAKRIESALSSKLIVYLVLEDSFVKANYGPKDNMSKMHGKYMYAVHMRLNEENAP